MNRVRSTVLIISCVGFCGFAFSGCFEPSPSRQGIAPATSSGDYKLIAHDNGKSAILAIDTETGVATEIGPTSFSSGASGLAVSGTAVMVAGETELPAGTVFGLLRDTANAQDWVVSVNQFTGEATKIVQTARSVGGRGIAFGADGATLYLMDGAGLLATIDLITGAVENEIGLDYVAVSLELDPASGSFYAISGSTLIRIETDGTVTEIGDLGVNACTLVRSPAGVWYTVNQQNNTLVTVDIGTATVTEIGSLGDASSGSVCGTAFVPARFNVAIDIKPGSDPNSINCHQPTGVIPVAILSSEGFDATTVDHATVTFEGATEWHVNNRTGEPKRHEEDVDGDGDVDLLLHFRRGDTALTCDSTEGTLRGETFDGLPVIGTDAVRMVPPR